MAIRSQHLLQLSAFSRTSISSIITRTRIPISNPIIRPFASYGSKVSVQSLDSLRVFARPQFFIQNLGLRSLRVSSGGGSGGGAAGGSGNSGGGGGGGASGGGNGGSNWSLLSWYMSLLAKHPMITKAVTSAVLTLVGDLVCQLAIDKVSSLDLKRTFIFTLLGLVLVGPTLHFWYLYLSKLITTPGASGAIMRLLLDHVTFSFPLCVYITSVDYYHTFSMHYYVYYASIDMQFIFAPIFIGTFLSTLVTLEGREGHHL